ncbi:TPA: DUF4214 domain-containing protein [Serratia marcescens]|nr:DUF4214 domain-containing protein [Serratia marcescens]
MNNLSAQQKVAAAYQAILGNKADTASLNFFAYQISSDKLSPSQLASQLISSQDGQTRYKGMSNEEKINYIYSNITGTPPDSDTLSKWVSLLEQGNYLGTIAISIINQLETYEGDDQVVLAQQEFLANNIATTLHPALNKSPEFIPDAANIQAIYYVIGGVPVAEGINFWADYLHSDRTKLGYIAQKFIEGRSALTVLNNEDFIKTLFQNAFKLTATPDDITRYLLELGNNGKTRGDVVVKMIADIRADSSHPEAKAQFEQATHVYMAGEMPAVIYQETVAAFYLTIAKTTVSASALDTWSKMLASGIDETVLLKQLAKSAQFSAASDFNSVYQTLYKSTLSASESQAILLKAANDKFAATTMIIKAFRDGKYPIDTHPAPPSHSLIQAYETMIGGSLNYEQKFNGTFTISADGKLMAAVNGHSIQALTNAEISSLRLQTTLKINATANHSVDLGFLSDTVTEIVLSGAHATSSQLLTSFNAKQHITLLLDDTGIVNAGGIMQVVNTTVFVEPQTNLNDANLSINMRAGGSLLWKGNSINGGANSVSQHVTAVNMDGATTASSQTGIVSANLITKDIYLTDSGSNGLQGIIASNLNQFLYFSFIELTHYRGTGNIYLNGELVATEGSNVFDFGVIDQRATVFNQAYNNIHSLQQAAHATQHESNYTGSSSPIISAFSGEITLLNLSSDTLLVNGDLTNKSRINIYDTQQSENKFTLSFTEPAMDLKYIDMGTISLTSAHKNTLAFTTYASSSHNVERSLTLSGGDNHISTIELSSRTTGPHITLDLTIKSDFTDSLKTINGIDASIGSVYSLIDLNLVSEKAGTGGGEFYNTLTNLNNSIEFGSVINALKGEQLNIGSTGLTVNSATVVGNTTVDIARQLTFTDSKIDNLITLNKNFQQSTILLGDNYEQWSFSSDGQKKVALYGSATTPAELNTVFSGINADNAESLFSQALAKLTQGASTNNLAEVGIAKLGKSVYVIVDRNHNQTFDADDSVFSIGDQDIYLAASELRYHVLPVTTNGIAETYVGTAV